MFTGIIQSVGSIFSIKDRGDFRTYSVRFPKKLLSGLSIGSSVSQNGCCLTVTNIQGDLVEFNIIEQTLEVTNLGTLKEGDEVNLERSMSMDREVGGHIMSGHIFGKAEISEVITYRHTKKFRFYLLNESLSKYIFEKGFIGIEGISLTLGEVSQDTFCVNFIPQTIRSTTFKNKKIKDIVNIEIEWHSYIIVKSLHNILASK